GPDSQLEPRSEPVTGAMTAVPREAVRENGPGGEPGVVAEDSPGPGAVGPDRMPADGAPRHARGVCERPPAPGRAGGEIPGPPRSPGGASDRVPRPERTGHFPEIRSELMRPRSFCLSLALSLIASGGGSLGAPPSPNPRYKLVLQVPPVISVNSVAVSPDG